MTDAQLFFLVFSLLYLSDCLVIVPFVRFGFVSWRNQVWRAVRPSELLGNQKKGVVAGLPLPPLGTLFVAGPWPISFSSQGISTLTIESPNPGSRPLQALINLKWEQVGPVRQEGSTIYISDQKFAKLPDPVVAHDMVLRIAAMRDLSPHEREPFLHQELRKSLNSSLARRTLRRFFLITRGLAWSCNLLFFLWFLAVPVAFLFFGFSQTTYAALITSAALTVVTAVQYICCFKKLFPKILNEGWQHFLIVLLAPQFTIRSRDSLARYLFSEFHGLAVAKVLLPIGEFSTLASRWQRDLRHPLPFYWEGEISPTAFEIAREFHQKFLLPAIENFLAPALENVESSLIPKPDADDAKFPRRCPRCHTRYLAKTSSCRDCQGIETEQIAHQR